MHPSSLDRRRPSLTALLMSAGAALLAGCLGEPVDLFSDGGLVDAEVGDLGPAPGDARLQVDGDIEPQPDMEPLDLGLPDMASPEEVEDAEVDPRDGELPDVVEPDMGLVDEGLPDEGLPDMAPIETPPLLFDAFAVGVQAPLVEHGCIDCHEAPGGSGGFGVYRQALPGSQELQHNYDAVAARCNPQNPTGSIFYLRLTTRHFGSDSFTPEEADVVRRWIAGGE